MERDAPWARSQNVKIRAGERLKLTDPQHRTRGAKSKGYTTSDRPKSFDAGFGTTHRKPSKERARAKRRMRREMERRNARIAPPLKDKNMTHTSTVIATEEKWIIHEGLKGKATKAHAESHAKLGIGVKASKECC